MGVFARVHIGDVTVSALDRFGGHSSAPYDSFNVADYVGDVEADVHRNLVDLCTMVDAQELAVMQAEHGCRATFASSGGMCEPADVIVSKSPGLALLALAADCVPIALVDHKSRVVSVAHMGWRGLLAGACTYEDTSLFSYRRADGPTGRGGLVVMLPSEGARHG